LGNQEWYGRHAFADSLQPKETVQENCESMRTLQNPHAFAVVNPGRAVVQTIRESMAHAWKAKIGTGMAPVCA